MRPRWLLFIALLAVFISHSPLTSAAPPSVAVSIKPLHSLIWAIMTGVGTPSLIVKGSRSPHSYSLKPSDARTLNKADLIVWVGPALEMFLEKPISALSSNAQVLTLYKGTVGDPHVWLNPALAISVVEQATAALSQIDPKHDAIYSKNADALKQRLRTLQKQGAARLAPVRNTAFLVFHDAWGHFAKAFGLSVAGAVAINPERPPGAKRILDIRRLIDSSGAGCLFREPQFESPLLLAVLEDHPKIKVLQLDPLGAALQPGPDLYFQMMQGNVESVADCLR